MNKLTSTTDPVINYFSKGKIMLSADYVMDPLKKTKITLLLDRYDDYDCNSTNRIYSGTMSIVYSESSKLVFKVRLISYKGELPELELMENLTERAKIIFQEAERVIDYNFRESF